MTVLSYFVLQPSGIEIFPSSCGKLHSEYEINCMGCHSRYHEGLKRGLSNILEDEQTDTKVWSSSAQGQGDEVRAKLNLHVLEWIWPQGCNPC